MSFVSDREPSILFTLALSVSTMAMSVLFVACGPSSPAANDATGDGEIITEEFVKDFSGAFEDKETGERWEIQPDQSLRLRKIRDVGTLDGPVPLQTTCTYFEEGRITKVIRRSQTSRDSYMSFAGTIIHVEIKKVSLDLMGRSRQNTLENCKLFEKTEAAKTSFYGIYAEILPGNQLRVHTSLSGGRSQDSVRDRSTLDEVFERVP